MDLSSLSDEDLLRAANPDPTKPDIGMLVSYASKKYEIPEELLRATMKHESGGKQSAISPKGAMGLMQLMPDTARGLNRDPKDPIDNFLGGAEYLKQQKDAFGGWHDALWAYNAGPERVKQGRMPSETKTYLSRIADTVSKMLGPSEAEAGTIPTEPNYSGEQLPTDIEAMSDDELARVAGIDVGKMSNEDLAKVAGIDLGKMSDEELAKIAGVELTQKPSNPVVAGVEIPEATRVDIPGNQASEEKPQSKEIDPDSFMGKVQSALDWFEQKPAPATGPTDLITRQIPEGIDKAVYQIGKGVVVGIPSMLADTTSRIAGGTATKQVNVNELPDDMRDARLLVHGRPGQILENASRKEAGLPPTDTDVRTEVIAEDTWKPYWQMIQGMADAVGTPLGAKGVREAINRWEEDPGGALTFVASLFFPFAKEKGAPIDVGPGENLGVKPSPPPSPLTPVSKSAAESAKVFIDDLNNQRNLYEPRTAEQSARVLETAAQRGELRPLESPSGVEVGVRETPPIQAASPEGTVAADFPITQGQPGELARPIVSEAGKVAMERGRGLDLTPQEVLDLNVSDAAKNAYNDALNAKYEGFSQGGGTAGELRGPTLVENLRGGQKTLTPEEILDLNVSDMDRARFIESLNAKMESFPRTQGQPGELNQALVRPGAEVRGPAPPITEAQRLGMEISQPDVKVEPRTTPPMSPGPPEGTTTPTPFSALPDIKPVPMEVPEGVRRVQEAIELAKEKKRLREQVITQKGETQAQIDTTQVDLLRQGMADRGYTKKSPLSSEGGFVNVGDMADWAKGIMRDARNLGIKITGQDRAWLDNTVRESTRQQRMLDNRIDFAIEKAVRPTYATHGKTSVKRSQFLQKSRDGIKYLWSLKDELKLTDADGNVVSGQLPQTLKQWGEAITQGKQKLYESFNEMAKSANDKGSIVDTSRVVDRLLGIANDKGRRFGDRRQSVYAAREAARLAEEGNLTPIEAQQAIQTLNLKLNSFSDYNTASKYYIDSEIVRMLRKELDESISKLEGPGYKDFKKQYGNLLEIERQVNNRATLDARRNRKGLIDFTDIFTVPKLIVGAITRDPTTLVTGAAMKLIKERQKLLNEPNRMVDRMFKEVDRVMSMDLDMPIESRPSGFSGIKQLAPAAAGGSGERKEE